LKKKVPGDPITWKSTAGETVAEVIQSHTPVKEFRTHLSAIVCPCTELKKQFPVHMYVSHVNEDVMQAIIMDSDERDARLIGVEYIITEKIFKQMPQDERKFWHSHEYEARSGLLVAPRLPWSAEYKLIKDLQPTYGKSFYFWDKDHALPDGVPQLLVAPTSDEMVRTDVVHERDRVLGISTEKEREYRKHLAPVRTREGANAFERGQAIKLEAKLV